MAHGNVTLVATYLEALCQALSRLVKAVVGIGLAEQVFEPGGHLTQLDPVLRPLGAR